ncbi:phosphatase PAP2 family protein [Candidatus Kapabacteria bacterium]|nr:phosphatase PAP2 family protein [Candidatus Kapabacteria bacterium]
MEELLIIDTKLFLFINKTLSNKITDLIMPIITNSKYWLPIYIYLFFYLIFLDYSSTNSYNNYFNNFIKKNIRGISMAILLAVGIGLSDQISAGLIKEWVGRLRPCNTIDNVNLLVNCGGGKSFPSAHATNNFFAASSLSFYFPKYKVIFYSLAALVALSRVFVGVHYPIDIIVGSFLGITISLILTKIYKSLLINN